MINILFPVAGLFLATFLVILFFTKKNDNNKETKIYAKMLIVNFIYSLICIVGYWYAKSIGNEFIIGCIQKIYMLTMLLLIVYIIIYNLNLINMPKQKVFKNCIWMSLVVFVLLTIFLPIQVINYDEILDGSGLSYDVVIIATILYFLIIIISSIYILIKNKDGFAKDIPFIVLLILYLLGLLVRKYFPSVMFENFFFSFMLLIMYHTIENPDIKLVNEISLAKNELEQANRIKNEFISSMSHEIRTPLNAIVGFSQIATMADTLEEAKENSKDLIAASENLLNIMNNMFLIFSIENENTEIKLESYNPKTLFMEVLQLYKKKIEEKGIDLNIEIENMPNLMGDKNIIKRVLVQILDNAYKYTTKGSITFKASYSKSYMTINIKDTGMGIKESDLKEIFIPFKKSSDTKNTSFSGAGVGLSISKSLLEKIGGKINIETCYKKGTNVSIKIKQKVGE